MRFMRVITGSCRGKKLKTLESLDTRPTTDMVKEAVFSIIQFDVPASSVLDLFAGSGQMGIEALSRGASHCVFVRLWLSSRIMWIHAVSIRNPVCFAWIVWNILKLPKPGLI